MILIIIIIILLIISSIAVAVYMSKKDPEEPETELVDLPEEIPEETLDLPETGLVAWYDAESFDGAGIIADKTDNGNDLTVKGTLTKNGDYLSGTAQTKIHFPKTILPPVYTFIHVARYGKTHKKRIFSSTNSNQLSGFWNGNSGVSHFDSWKTNSKHTIDSNWVLSVDSNKFYRGNTKDLTTKTNTGAGKHTSINAGQFKEFSDFDIEEIIVYNRALHIDEIQDIEAQLIKKYEIQNV